MTIGDKTFKEAQFSSDLLRWILCEFRKNCGYNIGIYTTEGANQEGLIRDLVKTRLSDLTELVLEEKNGSLWVYYDKESTPIGKKILQGGK